MVAEQLEEYPASHFTRPSVIRSWADAFGIRPSRSLGQNFLIDGNIRDILLDACGIGPGDGVLEIGPGLGAVTAGLLERGARVVAIEKDRRLLVPLEQHLRGYPGLVLIEGDALEEALPLLVEHQLTKVVSNLPYNPGSRILLDIVTSRHAPARIAVTVQDEVAERITAKPGTTDFSLMSLWCQVFYEVTYVKRVSANCFWPRPRVQSAIVRLCKRDQAGVSREGFPFFQALTKRMFQQPRKQMGHILMMLAGDPVLTGVHPADMLDPAWQHLRPADVTVGAWCALAESIRARITTAGIDHVERSKED